eukprot:6182851-Pleurochrysis_carterae.AAC.1
MIRCARARSQVRGLRAKMYNKKRYAEKAEMKKTIKQHAERLNKVRRHATPGAGHFTHLTKGRAAVSTLVRIATAWPEAHQPAHTREWARMFLYLSP